MKKVLIIILTVLLIILAYFAIFKGLVLGNIKVLSVGGIVESNDDLTSNIEQAKTLLEKDYPSKKEELSKSMSKLLEEKEKYFGIAKISTDGEIAKANTEETYLIEYLWTRIGRHATSEGVNLKMDVSSGDTGEANMKNLAFTVTGEYIGIMEFITALENDEKLNFKIENFKMTKNSTNLTSTFTVRGIRIKVENVVNNSGQSNVEEDRNLIEENAQDDTSKFNQLTGAVNNTLAPAENNAQ